MQRHKINHHAVTKLDASVPHTHLIVPCSVGNDMCMNDIIITLTLKSPLVLMILVQMLDIVQMQPLACLESWSGR